MSRLDVRAARCEALFVSRLQPSQDPDVEQVRVAIQEEIRMCGWRGCLVRVAQEFGEHPETAVVRMRWAKQMVSRAYDSCAANGTGAPRFVLGHRNLNRPMSPAAVVTHRPI